MSSPTAVGPRRPNALVDVWRVTGRNMLRTAMYAALIRLCIGGVKSLLKCKGQLMTLLKLLRGELLSTNPLKWALVFGGWAAFRGVKRTLEAIIGAGAAPALPPNPEGEPPTAAYHGSLSVDEDAEERAKRRVSSVLAGAIVGLPVLVMNVQTRTELGLYLFIRACHGVATTYVLPALPPALRDFPHWDVVGVGTSGSFILYGIMFEPLCHSPSYEAFLEACTMMPRKMLDGFMCHHRSVTVPSIVEYCQEKHLPLPPPHPGVMPPGFTCTFQHPGMSCNENFFRWCVKHLIGFSGRLYVPLKITMTLALHPKAFVKAPGTTLARIAQSSLLSSLFLTLYCAGPFRLVCFMSNHNIRAGWLIGLFAGILCGTPTFLEPKSRRLDLALYCWMHALRFVRLLLYVRGVLGRPTRHQVLAMYLTATAILFHQWEHTRESLHPNVRKGLAMVLNEPEREEKDK